MNLKYKKTLNILNLKLIFFLNPPYDYTLIIVDKKKVTRKESEISTGEHHQDLNVSK